MMIIAPPQWAKYRSVSKNGLVHYYSEKPDYTESTGMYRPNTGMVMLAGKTDHEECSIKEIKDMQHG